MVRWRSIVRDARRAIDRVIDCLGDWSGRKVALVPVRVVSATGKRR
jgi:hypothetical protein